MENEELQKTIKQLGDLVDQVSLVVASNSKMLAMIDALMRHHPDREAVLATYHDLLKTG